MHLAFAFISFSPLFLQMQRRCDPQHLKKNPVFLYEVWPTHIPLPTNEPVVFLSIGHKKVNGGPLLPLNFNCSAIISKNLYLNTYWLCESTPAPSVACSIFYQRTFEREGIPLYFSDGKDFTRSATNEGLFRREKVLENYRGSKSAINPLCLTYDGRLTFKDYKDLKKKINVSIKVEQAEMTLLEWEVKFKHPSDACRFQGLDTEPSYGILIFLDPKTKRPVRKFLYEPQHYRDIIEKIPKRTEMTSEFELPALKKRKLLHEPLEPLSVPTCNDAPAHTEDLEKISQARDLLTLSNHSTHSTQDPSITNSFSMHSFPTQIIMSCSTTPSWKPVPSLESPSSGYQLPYPSEPPQLPPHSFIPRIPELDYNEQIKKKLANQGEGKHNDIIRYVHE